MMKHENLNKAEVCRFDGPEETDVQSSSKRLQELKHISDELFWSFLLLCLMCSYDSAGQDQKHLLSSDEDEEPNEH